MVIVFFWGCDILSWILASFELAWLEDLGAILCMHNHSLLNSSLKDVKPMTWEVICLSHVDLSSVGVAASSSSSMLALTCTTNCVLKCKHKCVLHIVHYIFVHVTCVYATEICVCGAWVCARVCVRATRRSGFPKISQISLKLITHTN
jgi:hypothetical protein